MESEEKQQTPPVEAALETDAVEEKSGTSPGTPEEGVVDNNAENAATEGEQQSLPEMSFGESDEGGLSADELLGDAPRDEPPAQVDNERLKAVLEAIIYITDEPLTLDQIATAIEQPKDRVAGLLDELGADYERADRGLSIREVAGGFKMATKPEHHDAVRRFVKNLNPPLKLSLPALETLAVIAYKQPITAPEIMEIRGVQGAGVLKTLLDRKLIGTAGRKQVVGKPILYKTTKEFLVQFGLRDLAELPTLKEFQEIGRMDTGAANEVAEPVAMSQQVKPDAGDGPHPETVGESADEVKKEESS